MLDFDAGRYALFVWPAYAVSAVVLLAMIVDSLRRAARWRRLAERQAEPSTDATP